MPASHQPVDGGLYGRSFADVYDQWYGDLHEPLVVARAIRRHVGSPAIDAAPTKLLELGSGSGRLAGPLAHTGFDVIALDISAAMQGQDRSASKKVRSDMTVLPVADASIDVVLIAYNTLLTLPGPDLQARCLAECARVLAPGGCLAVESFIAEPGEPGESVTRLSVRDHHTDPNGRVVIATTRTRTDGDRFIGLHVELTSEGVRSRPWQLSYLAPEALASMATDAGLRLESRTGDWEDRPYDPTAARYVGWYRRPPSGTAPQ